jgi:hypothetical protein
MVLIRFFGFVCVFVYCSGPTLTFGGDADTRSYVTAGGAVGGSPYVSTIAKPEAQHWDAWKSQGLKVIPPVSAGWDNRPRKDYPCPCGISFLLNAAVAC